MTDEDGSRTPGCGMEIEVEVRIDPTGIQGAHEDHDDPLEEISPEGMESFKAMFEKGRRRVYEKACGVSKARQELGFPLGRSASDTPRHRGSETADVGLPESFLGTGAGRDYRAPPRFTGGTGSSMPRMEPPGLSVLPERPPEPTPEPQGMIPIDYEARDEGKDRALDMEVWEHPDNLRTPYVEDRVRFKPNVVPTKTRMLGYTRDTPWKPTFPEETER